MTAQIRRVSGPLVEIDAFPGVAMNDLVTLGEVEITAEVVGITDGRVTLQAYEYTGGLGPGTAVTPLRRPLSARLAPDLLGGVFDGLLRPLTTAPVWLTPGPEVRDLQQRWHFRPLHAVGATVDAGAVLGSVQGGGPLEYRVLVPPSVRGRVDRIAAEGEYTADEPVATIAGTPVTIAQYWPVRTARPIRRRRPSTVPLRTGQRAVDLLFPVAKGATVAVPGGFGTGKTMLLQQLAKWCDADVIVYIGCGERGNEMAEVVAELFSLTDPRTGGRLADRTVVVANTSNMPMMAREAGIYTGVTVAEYFRDMGYHTVVIADSTSRWAEALREFASRVGALPAEEGYPADLASALAAFYERAGMVETLAGTAGSVTIVGAVSPPGGDLSEPVTVHTERFVRCRWTLDRELAYARHYPAVSWSASFSHDADILSTSAADSDRAVRRGRVLGLLAEADRLTALTELVGVNSLPADQRVTLLAGRLLRDGVLAQNALSPNDSYCSEAKTDAVADAALAVIDRCRALVRSAVAPEQLEAVDFGPLIRAPEAADPEDITSVNMIRDHTLGRLDDLARPHDPVPPAPQVAS
ncbi:V-type ATP synthase subunit A [Nocardia sp. alder85J]|uniref:V-type ATP synthase subunit A n=1 Tax=Nocardia sp. alder85J TaxID=2862949 RepID=UPI001CD37402|nr:V-type ATP synthase subunit A [Nocardia sp. alder85J]MCX4092456.1 V-type ATP synthase subunit A [Nocardia sp. alder85J]